MPTPDDPPGTDRSNQRILDDYLRKDGDGNSEEHENLEQTNEISDSSESKPEESTKETTATEFTAGKKDSTSNTDENDTSEALENNRKNEVKESSDSESQTDDKEIPDNISRASKIPLNPRQQPLFQQELKEFESWMLDAGKDPENNDGLADTTVQNNVRRIDKIFRWVWNTANEILLQIPHEWADEYCSAMDNDEIKRDDGEPYSISHKRKNNDALRKYFEWRAHEKGGSKWTPPIEFDDKSHRQADEFSSKERRKLRESVLTYDSIPSYSDCDPEQRDRLKAYLAQRLGKPKEEITPEDWENVKTSWERVSLIWVALDAGLRPIEVHNATVEWVRIEKQSLHIPKDEASKNRENWEVALLPQTVDILRRWKKQRNHLDRYDGTDKLWLTREGNPWGSDSLNYLLRRVCDEAGIERMNRRIVWYSIRHSVGEHMTNEGGIEQTKEQLRQKSVSSTLKYTHPSVSDRQSTLEDMG